jgi:hypothetical protein
MTASATTAATNVHDGGSAGSPSVCATPTAAPLASLVAFSNALVQ